MAVTDPPLQSPPLEGLPNKLTRIWDRFFRDVFSAAGGNAGNPYPTGVILDYTGTTAPAGWILAQEGFIGNRTSGADVIAADAARDLYVIWWNSFSDTIATVSGGRGTSGLQDFKDGKQMKIPIKPGTVLGLAGTHIDYTARSFGDEVGTETHTLTTSESGLVAHTHTINITDPGHNHTQNAHTHTQNAHTHTVSDSGHTHGAGTLKGRIGDTDGSTDNTAADNCSNASSYSNTQTITGSTASGTTGITIGSTTATNQNTTATNNSNTTGITASSDASAAVSATSAHNIMQPTIFVNKIIKL